MDGHHGNRSLNMGTSASELKCKFKRKRRRRNKSKGHASTLSTFISPLRCWDIGQMGPADGDAASTNSLEVKENQNHGNKLDCTKRPKTRPATFYTTRPRGEPRALKRKQPLVDGKDRLLYQNHFPCKRRAWSVTQKNALVQLNELRPGLKYEIMSKTGPLHAPVFSISVEVNGLRFEGQGPTKKQAKMRAAELALQSFVQFANASQAHHTMDSFSKVATDFTTDQLDFSGALLKDFELAFENCDFLHRSTGGKEFLSEIYNHRRLLRLTVDFLSSARSKRQTSTSILEELGPVALLHELLPGLRYMCLSERVHGKPVRRFVMVLQVEGRIFEGCGSSKRLAKAQAATAALQALYNISLGPERKLQSYTISRAKNQLPQCFAESLFRLVREKYEELTDNRCSTSHGRHKGLAGIVMTMGFDLCQAQVVALGTGTKSISQEGSCDSGAVLTDCHAEVIVRRAFIHFLYSQLELLLSKQANDSGESIFIPNKGRGYKLRDQVLFHMYVSSSPCGDARLNCPYELTATHHTSPRLVRRFRCHLRRKMEGREGTLPVVTQLANQKREGVSLGKTHASMSCTDKMAKWNVLGLQGALLSQLVEPVYLHSLTVGTLGHTGHLSRVLAQRFRHTSPLPFPYRRNQLLLGCLSSSESHLSGKSSPISVNWTSGDGGLEEVSCFTGRRTHSGTPSRLCKRSLFTRWQRLHLQFNRQTSDMDNMAKTYFGAKMSAEPYQRARQQFSLSLQQAGLGTWARKPPELDLFQVCT